MEICFDQINWELVIGVCAIIISGIALRYSIQQTKIQRIHNLKSVKPLGRIRIGDYENDIYVSIENSGTGPMIIKEVISEKGDKQSIDKFIDIIDKQLAARIPWTNFTGRYPNRSIMPGSYLELLKWTTNSYSEGEEQLIEKDRNELRSELGKSKVTIKYTDIYDSEIFTDELEFGEWYNRHS